MIEFYSESCIPCGKAKPIVDRLIEEGYAIRPVSIDDEKGRGEALKRQVTSIPTFITYENFDNRVTWTEVGRFSGIDHLKERIRQALKRKRFYRKFADAKWRILHESCRRLRNRESIFL